VDGVPAVVRRPQSQKACHKLYYSIKTEIKWYSRTFNKYRGTFRTNQACVSCMAIAIISCFNA